MYPILAENSLQSGMVYSVLFHLAGFALVSLFLLLPSFEKKNDEISIQVYTGPVTGVVGEGSAVGKGSKRPALKKKSSSFATGKTDSSNPGQEEGTEDGLEDGTGVDWGSAADPALDGGSRYTANIVVEISADDYPESARRSNLGSVKVGVTLLVSSLGKISDVKIRYMRADGGDLAPFKTAFVEATRKIFLKKARLVNLPYKQDGSAKNFKWDTSVTYTLQ